MQPNLSPEGLKNWVICQLNHALAASNLPTQLSLPHCTIPKPDPHLYLLLTGAMVGFRVSMSTSGCTLAKHLGVYIPIPSSVGAPQLDL